MRLSLLVAAAVLAMPVCGDTLTETELAAEIGIGDEIVEALAAYEAHHGHYPEELDALTPDFMNVVPGPRIGNEFGYRLARSGEHFVLSFRVGPNRACGWQSFFGRWECTYDAE